jgi:hypothetical protein
MTEHKNDERNWIVAVLTNGWMKVAFAEQAENIAKQKAEALALDPTGTKCDLEEHDLSLVEAVFIYQRKGTVTAKKVAAWS